jgi:hypothetical protein
VESPVTVEVSTSPAPSFDSAALEEAESRVGADVEQERKKIMSSAKAAVLQTEIVLANAEAKAAEARLRSARRKMQLMVDELEIVTTSSSDDVRGGKRVKRGVERLDEL